MYTFSTVNPSLISDKKVVIFWKKKIEYEKMYDMNMLCTFPKSGELFKKKLI